MRQDASFAIPVKLIAIICTIVGVSLTGNVIMTCLLTGFAFVHLIVQRNFRLAVSFGIFYGVLALLLYLIRFHGLRMVIFSEFYVLMFWNLSSVFLVSWDLVTSQPGEISSFLSKMHVPTGLILGLLVVFRFFPTMRAELHGVYQSMKNRGLAGVAQVITHPIASMEYVLVPLLLRILQIADQLSVSAVARGAERPGVRGSFYGKKMCVADWLFSFLWIVITILFLIIGGIR